AVYLINLAGDDATLRSRSEGTLAGYLAAADRLGIDGVIFHTGSHKGVGFEKVLPQIRDHLLRVMARADPKQAHLLIENNAGLGEIGDVGFRALLHEPRLQKMPFILEVPGADGQGPDKANLDALRRLAA